MLLALTTFILGAVWLVAGLAHLWLFWRARRDVLKLEPRRRIKPWAELDRDGRLARLGQADAVLGFALGDEPFPDAKCFRKENAR